MFRYLFEATFGEAFPKATVVKNDLITKTLNSQEYKDALKKEYLNSRGNDGDGRNTSTREISDNLKKYVKSPDTYFENVDTKSDLYTNKETGPTVRKIPMRDLYKNILAKEYKAKVQGKNLSNDSSLLFPTMVHNNIYDIERINR